MAKLQTAQTVRQDRSELEGAFLASLALIDAIFAFAKGEGPFPDAATVPSAYQQQISRLTESAKSVDGRAQLAYWLADFRQTISLLRDVRAGVLRAEPVSRELMAQVAETASGVIEALWEDLQ